MKKIFSAAIFVLVASMLFAQIPQAFKYQAIARDAAGEVLADETISIKVILLSGSSDGVEEYNELHTVTTNSFGLINLNVGDGDYPSRSFSEIDWGNGNIYIQIEMDQHGGSNFKKMGTARLLSVPYALYAETSGDSQRGTTEWTNDGTDIYNDETVFPDSKVGIGTTQPAGKLDIYGVGITNPNGPMLFVQHQGGFSSTFRRYQNGPANALFLLQKSRGTLGLPSVVQSGDNIGQVRMEGYDGSAYKTAGWLRVAVDGTVSSGIVPGALLFATTDTTGSVIERMRINSTGNVGIGVTNPTEVLETNGIIRSNAGFDHNGNTGVSDTINVVVDNDFTLDKLRYRTLAYSGGILTFISDTSAWLDSIGSFIPPSFTQCGMDLYDVRDGQTYATIEIGIQCWMAENLNIGTKMNSTTSGQLQTGNGVIEKYCYNNEEDSCDVYGGLYEWNEAMQYVADTGAQGICPMGWHIPSDAEWKTLEGNVDSQYGVGDSEWDDTGFRGFDVGENLKSNSGWFDNGNGTDLYGFDALPGGYRGSDGNFNDLSKYTGFWSSTEYGGLSAWYRGQHYSTDKGYRRFNFRTVGLAVRCLKDFTCGDSLTDTRDGQKYSTVQIGTQCWMAENLNLGTRINGSSGQTNNATLEKYCYNDIEDSCNVYGGLYQWDETMHYVTTEGTQGICPGGWHIPSDGEWTILSDYLGGNIVAGGKMKEAGYDHWASPNLGATNSSGFTGLPGGYRSYSSGSFYNLGYLGFFWSSTEDGASFAWNRMLYYDIDDVGRGNYYKTYGFSVRCLKDD